MPCFELTALLECKCIAACVLVAPYEPLRGFAPYPNGRTNPLPIWLVLQEFCADCSVATRFPCIGEMWDPWTMARSDTFLPTLPIELRRSLVPLGLNTFYWLVDI